MFLVLFLVLKETSKVLAFGSIEVLHIGPYIGTEEGPSAFACKCRNAERQDLYICINRARAK